MFATVLDLSPTRHQLVQHVSDDAIKLVGESVDVTCRHCADGLCIQPSSKCHRVNDLHITVCKLTMACARAADVQLSGYQFVVRAARIMNINVA